MTSFAQEVKNELAHLTLSKKCCNVAQLNAMIKVRSKINSSGNIINFRTTNAAVARNVLKLIKSIYSNARTEVSVTKNRKLNINNMYTIKIFYDAEVKLLFESVNKNKYPINSCCQRAYLRGLFMSAGTINRPEANGYHLEIVAESEETSKMIYKLMNNLNLNANKFNRENRYIIYLKTFDSICDFLYIVGAKNAVDRYESAQNLKEVKLRTHRMVNCETANIQRAINAAQRQIKDIEIIRNRNLKLDDKLKEVADARLEYPDLTINELAKKLYISSSGLKHRMQKIHLMATQ